jgi:hypothetical protein
MNIHLVGPESSLVSQISVKQTSDTKKLAVTIMTYLGHMVFNIIFWRKMDLSSFFAVAKSKHT